MAGDPETSVEVGQKQMTVAEAAAYLRVSRRTIYRHLRSGKLRSVPLNVSRNSRDNSDIVTVVTTRMRDTNDTNEGEVSCHKMSQYVTNGLEDLSQDRIQALQREIQQKDEQIATLLETQRELTRTVQRLQEQIYELARLALQLNQSQGDTSGDTAISVPAKSKSQSFLNRIFGRRDNKPDK